MNRFAGFLLMLIVTPLAAVGAALFVVVWVLLAFALLLGFGTVTFRNGTLKWSKR